MCEKDLLVEYLYDDMAAGDRAAFESHLRECADCRDELKALRGVRVDLDAWAPPPSDFGFRVVRGGVAAFEHDVVRTPAPPWGTRLRAWWTPAAGLAAAAVLVLAAASALAHIEVHRGPDGITVRTGWGASAPASAVTVSTAGFGGSAARDTYLPSGSPTDAAFLAGLERRLNALEAATRDGGLRNAATLSARSSDAQTLKLVRELLAKSETKQQGELALRIQQVFRDVEAQRMADLKTIQSGLSSLDANVRDASAAHRDLTNYILSSAKQK